MGKRQLGDPEMLKCQLISFCKAASFMSTRLTSRIRRCIRALRMRVACCSRVDVDLLAFPAGPLPQIKEMPIVAVPAELTTDVHGKTTNMAGQGLGV